MRIVFWQNCLSPHQLPYIIKLTDDERVDSVVIATGETISKERERMGWDMAIYPGIEKCKVAVNPSAAEMESLLGERVGNSIHLFSGIRGFAFVFDAFKRSMKIAGLRRGLIMERPNTYAYGCASGKPLWMHRLKWKILEQRNMDAVKCVFAMGEDAMRFYASLNKKWKVYPFGYCTCENEIHTDDSTMIGCLRIVFAGNLSWWKSVDKLLVSTTILIKCNRRVHLDIIGDGPERMKLERYVDDNGMKHVAFLGTQQQSMVPELMAKADVLILPSIYDGWGAVVNEALQQGLYVICSNRCGAKDLLHDDKCGSVFRGGDVEDLTKRIEYAYDNINRIRADRQWRKEWASRYISGDAMAEYMVDCLYGIRRDVPWKNKKTLPL